MGEKAHDPFHCGFVNISKDRGLQKDTTEVIRSANIGHNKSETSSR
jgi:hypothetical protein